MSWLKKGFVPRSSLGLFPILEMLTNSYLFDVFGNQKFLLFLNKLLFVI